MNHYWKKLKKKNLIFLGFKRQTSILTHHINKIESRNSCFITIKYLLKCAHLTLTNDGFHIFPNLQVWFLTEAFFFAIRSVFKWGGRRRASSNRSLRWCKNPKFSPHHCLKSPFFGSCFSSSFSNGATDEIHRAFLAQTKAQCCFRQNQDLRP